MREHKVCGLSVRRFSACGLGNRVALKGWQGLQRNGNKKALRWGSPTVRFALDKSVDHLALESGLRNGRAFCGQEPHHRAWVVCLRGGMKGQRLND